jgi:hypothetical protein
MLTPGQVLGHMSGGLAKVTRETKFFILQICKKEIILAKNLQKNN